MCYQHWPHQGFHSAPWNFSTTENHQRSWSPLITSVRFNIAKIMLHYLIPGLPEPSSSTSSVHSWRSTVGVTKTWNLFMTSHSPTIYLCRCVWGGSQVFSIENRSIWSAQEIWTQWSRRGNNVSKSKLSKSIYKKTSNTFNTRNCLYV